MTDALIDLLFDVTSHCIYCYINIYVFDIFFSITGYCINNCIYLDVIGYYIYKYYSIYFI